MFWVFTMTFSVVNFSFRENVPPPPLKDTISTVRDPFSNLPGLFPFPARQSKAMRPHTGLKRKNVAIHLSLCLLLIWKKWPHVEMQGSTYARYLHISHVLYRYYAAKRNKKKKLMVNVRLIGIHFWRVERLAKIRWWNYSTRNSQSGSCYATICQTFCDVRWILKILQLVILTFYILLILRYITLCQLSQ